MELKPRRATGMGCQQRAVAGPSHQAMGGEVATPVGLQGRALRQEDYSGVLQVNVVCPIRFWIYLRPVTPYLFPISLFWMVMSI